MPYSLEYETRASRDLSRLDAGVAQQMRDALVRMAGNAEAVRHRALTGALRGQFRLRMGHYRAIYEIDRANRRITVLRVEHRSDAYR